MKKIILTAILIIILTYLITIWISSNLNQNIDSEMDEYKNLHEKLVINSISCKSDSMTHYVEFDEWWWRHGWKYINHNITKEQFKEFEFSNGVGNDILECENKQNVNRYSFKIEVEDMKIGDVIGFGFKEECFIQYKNTDNKEFLLLHRLAYFDEDGFPVFMGDNNKKTDTYKETNCFDDTKNSYKLLDDYYNSYYSDFYSKE